MFHGFIILKSYTCPLFPPAYVYSIPGQGICIFAAVISLFPLRNITAKWIHYTVLRHRKMRDHDQVIERISNLALKRQRSHT